MHHYAGQTLLVLVGLYVIQLVLTWKCRAPREFVFWTAVFMGLCVRWRCCCSPAIYWRGIRTANPRRWFGLNFLMHVCPWWGTHLFKLVAGVPGPVFGSAYPDPIRYVSTSAYVRADFSSSARRWFTFGRKADDAERALKNVAGTPMFPESGACVARSRAAL